MFIFIDTQISKNTFTSATKSGFFVYSIFHFPGRSNGKSETYSPVLQFPLEWVCIFGTLFLKKESCFGFLNEVIKRRIMKILIVEDEHALLETIANYLQEDGFLCEKAGDYFHAEEKLIAFDYDAIILDIGLPDGNGLDLLQQIKKENKNMGILIVSAKNALDDKIKGLDLGADDYISKPFHLSELNSRLRAVLRRRKFEGNNHLVFEEIAMNPDERTVTIHQKALLLTPKEFELLLFFIVNKNRVLNRQSIAEHLWGDYMDMADRFDFVYTHINNLRKKLKEAGAHDYIQTIYGIGYKFSAS